MCVGIETNCTPQPLQGRPFSDTTEGTPSPTEPGELSEKQSLVGVCVQLLGLPGREGVHVCFLWGPQSAWAGWGCVWERQVWACTQPHEEVFSMAVQAEEDTLEKIFRAQSALMGN